MSHRVFRQLRIDERLLRIVQDVPHRIDTFIEITHIYTECLFSHRTLIAVARRLIMVAKRDIDTENAIHQTRVYFAMRVKRRQSSPFDTFFQIDGKRRNHRRVDFVAIHIFQEPFFVQIFLRVILVFRDFVGDDKVVKVLIGNVFFPTDILSSQDSLNPQFTLIRFGVYIDNIERSIHSPRFRADDDTRLLDIPHNRGHRIDNPATLVMLQGQI